MWLALTVEYQRVSLNRVGENINCCLVFFNSDCGMVISRYSDWLQHLMNVLISHFRQYGLASEITKYRTIICRPGALRTEISEESRERKCTGVGDSYHDRL